MHFFSELCPFFNWEKKTFFNIPVITEDIYLKLGVCVHYPESNPYYQGRQFKMHFFFLQNNSPFFSLDFLFSIKHPTAERWHQHAVLLFTNYNHILLICRLLSLGMTLYHTIPRLLTTLRKKPFENVGKGENAGNGQFLHFQKCFLPTPTQISIFYSALLCRLQMLSVCTSLKFCCLVKS